MKEGDTLLIVGTSFYTSISSQIKRTAEMNGVNIVVINADAETEVRKYLEEHTEDMEGFDTFIEREPSWSYNFSPYDFI